MTNRNILFVALLAATASGLKAEPVESDSVVAGGTTPVVMVSGEAKQVGRLDQQPLSYSVLTQQQMNRRGMSGLKEAAQFAPNLYMPDYGSRLTSAIYLRGIGSRIGTPAVGMQVDGVAYSEKSAFDFDFGDVERLEVLRGPQSTLYGRNTMGGLLRIETLNPLFARQTGSRTRISLGGSTRDAGRYARLLQTGLAGGGDAAYLVSAFYRGRSGFSRNTYLDRRSNGMESGGGRFRYVYNSLRHPDFTADFQTSLEYSDEHGYDYYNVADGRIQEGELGNYRRTLLNTSLRLEKAWPHLTLSSVSSWQFLRDRMFMDQDFSPASVFTLEQRQRSSQLSEELTLKSHENERLEWLAGAYVSNQWLKTEAPVNFGSDGVARYIQSGIDEGFAAANAAMNPMGMSLAMNVSDRTLRVDGSFDTPTLNAAAFAHVRMKNLLVSKLDLSAGLRLDYEHTKLDYLSGATAHFNFQMTRANRTLVNQDFTTDSRYDGLMHKDHTQLLPQFALSYNLGERENDDIVYLSVSKGFRSGGYNVQLFSDLVQASLRNDMMRTLADDARLGSYLNRYMQIGDNPSADSITVYKPETSWNYELGTRLHLADRRLTLSASVFYIATRNQQIARFSPNGFGRQMVNAGKSESYGAEMELQALLSLFSHPLTLNASYGYTHATFVRYDAGEDDGQSYVYDGNYVPFAPLHNMALAAEYVIPVKNLYLHLGANLTAQGRIYWTEDNAVSQPFYALLGAHVGADFGKVRLNVWGKNLTDTRYVPFQFLSMGQYYAQRCRPIQLGIDLQLTL